MSWERSQMLIICLLEAKFSVGVCTVHHLTLRQFLFSNYIWFVNLIVHWFLSKFMLAFWLNTVQIKVRVIGCTCTHSKAGFRIKKNISTTIISILMIITVQIMQFIWHFRFSAVAAAYVYNHIHTRVTVYRAFVLHA